MNGSGSSRETKIEMAVGVFVVLMLAALSVFTILVSGATLFKDTQFEIEVVMPDVMGLRRNDPVIAKGTTVGTVSEVYYDLDGVHVKAELDAPVIFYEDYSITVVATSILGGRQLVLREGSDELPEVENVRALTGEKPSDMMEDAAEAISSVRKFLETDALENLRVFSKDISDISGRLNRGEGTLGRLLSSDDEMYTNLNATVANLRSISDRLEAGEGTLGKLLSSDDEMYTNLNATVANLRSISDRLEAGEGTLGKLLSSDDEMYNNINGAVSDVRELLDDMREANTLSTFSSLLFSGI